MVWESLPCVCFAFLVAWLDPVNHCASAADFGLQSLGISNIHWNTSNAMFRIDNTDHIIDVPEGARVNIICPFYIKALTPNESDTEQYIIYAVNKEEFDMCRIMRAQPRRIAECDNPYKLKYFTISFRSFSPLPGAMQFEPGEDYHFISTSEKEDLHQRVEGACRSNNMKVVFKVNDGKLTTKRPGKGRRRGEGGGWESEISDRAVNLDSNGNGEWNEFDDEGEERHIAKGLLNGGVESVSDTRDSFRGIGASNPPPTRLADGGDQDHPNAKIGDGDGDQKNTRKKDKKRRKKTRRRKGSPPDNEDERVRQRSDNGDNDVLDGNGDNFLLNDKPPFNGEGPVPTTRSASFEVPARANWNNGEDLGSRLGTRTIEKELSLVEKVNNLMKQKASIRTSFNGALSHGASGGFLFLNLITLLLLLLI